MAASIATLGTNRPTLTICSNACYDSSRSAAPCQQCGCAAHFGQTQRVNPTMSNPSMAAPTKLESCGWSHDGKRDVTQARAENVAAEFVLEADLD